MPNCPFAPARTEVRDAYSVLGNHHPVKLRYGDFGVLNRDFVVNFREIL